MIVLVDRVIKCKSLNLNPFKNVVIEFWMLVMQIIKVIINSFIKI